MTKRNYRFRALVMMGVAALAAALMVALPVAVQPAYASTTFTVNSTADLPDANLDDTVNVCDADTSSQGEQCTLRAAIGEANYTQGADTITLPAETYTLSRAGDFEDASSTGDLDITDELTITGAGARATIVAGGEAPFDDRIFHNQPGAKTTITGSP